MPGPDSRRFDRIDALRGAAMVWMAGFHFAFDLDHFGFVRQDFYRDPRWTVQRVCILSTFLFVAGIGQAIALDAGQPAARFLRRWAQVAAAALAVSLGSVWMFPESWISFGVLHAIAIGLLLLRATRGTSNTSLLLLGALALAAPSFFTHPFFDSRWTDPIGLVTRKPVTEDYVPLLPWFGVMAWGFAFGRIALAARPGLLAGSLPSPRLAPLAALGRRSLAFYLLHQPVLIGGLMAWRALRPV